MMTILIVFKVHEDFIVCLLAQPGSSMVTRRSSRSSSTGSTKPLFPNSCFICGRHTFSKTKRIVARKILTLLAKATVMGAANDKMCDFYFQSKDLDLIAHDLLCL